MAVPAGESVEYPCELSIKHPGPFEAEITLFLEDNGIREVTLSVKGVAVAAEGQSDAPPAKP